MAALQLLLLPGLRADFLSVNEVAGTSGSNSGARAQLITGIADCLSQSWDMLRPVLKVDRPPGRALTLGGKQSVRVGVPSHALACLCARAVCSCP